MCCCVAGLTHAPWLPHYCSATELRFRIRLRWASLRTSSSRIVALMNEDMLAMCLCCACPEQQCVTIICQNIAVQRTSKQKTLERTRGNATASSSSNSTSPLPSASNDRKVLQHEVGEEHDCWQLCWVQQFAPFRQEEQIRRLKSR